jgi:flagellar motor switch protein FliN
MKIAQYIESALRQAISNMAAKSVTVALDALASEPQTENAVIWQQPFSFPESATLWIAAGKDVWDAVGRITLEAAGIEDASEEDCRSTWQELLSQTAGGIASALTTAAAREVTAQKGALLEKEPDGSSWEIFTIADAGKSWAFKAAWTKDLAAFCEPTAEEAAALPGARESANSKTFDLLMDVALPVAVSFGKTALEIREVLKLNTGSIVELDRFVSDPVEVIVNDCVIARGEVVVVDGNYGVRISQLASREDRLRTADSISHI